VSNECQYFDQALCSKPCISKREKPVRKHVIFGHLCYCLVNKLIAIIYKNADIVVFNTIQRWIFFIPLYTFGFERLIRFVNGVYLDNSPNRFEHILYSITVEYSIIFSRGGFVNASSSMAYKIHASTRVVPTKIDVWIFLFRTVFQHENGGMIICAQAKRTRATDYKINK